MHSFWQKGLIVIVYTHFVSKDGYTIISYKNVVFIDGRYVYDSRDSRLLIYLEGDMDTAIAIKEKDEIDRFIEEYKTLFNIYE